MQTIVFKGTVFSGAGEGRKFVALPWVKKQIKEKLGFTPYLGTLNIRLPKGDVIKKKLLEKTEHFDIYPEDGYCTGILIKACVSSVECAIIMPQVPNYRSDVLELVAPLCLREQLKLVDGNELAVAVNV